LKETRIEREEKRQRNRDIKAQALVDAEESLQIDLADLYHANSTYTPEQKVNAVMTFVLTGTIKKSAKILGMPQQTLNEWKNKAVWWDDTVAECRKKKQDELDSMYTVLIHDAIEQVSDRVNNGDTKVDRNGLKTVVPMTGKDLAIVMAVTFDKRQLLRGEATSRIEKVSEKDRIDRLADSFKDMSVKMKNNGFDTKVINEVIEDGTEEEGL